LSEAQKRTPRPVAERRDAKSFPLSPTDGFVLSRVDGNLNEGDLSVSTGIPEEQVRASLAKLEGLGLIAFDIGPANTNPQAAAGPRASFVRAASPAPATTPSASHVSRVPSPPPPASPPQPATTAPVTRRLSAEEQAALAEDVDLEPEIRRRVIDAFHDLDRRDHYALLGVEENADRKAIKRAYYDLAATFHPDRYFRKRLGSFKVRMEAVFARLTIAHDTVSDKAKRNEYDVYLSEQRISQAIEENLARGASEAKQAEESVERTVRAEVGDAPPPPPAPSSSPQIAITSSPQIDVTARREALARRLLGGNQARPASSPTMATVKRSESVPMAPSSSPMAASDAVNALRRRYEERMERAKQSEARKFAVQAEVAAKAGDLVAAANAFRIAANLTKSDTELEKRAQEARLKADGLLSETYTRQARYEESHDQWPEAARSWGRVCRANPKDANAHERAAHAIVKTSGDLHDAARAALRACELEPRNALFRITLASCYSAAGLVLNARRELDTAAQLAPHDDTIQAMIKRVGHPA
jgi:curved DNA-binding protein CbpA